MADGLFGEERSVPNLVFRIASIQYLDLRRLLSRLGITPEQAAIAKVLYEKGAVNQKELSDFTFKDQANTTRILKRMEAKSLVSIAVSEKDKRMNIVRLTEQGVALCFKVRPLIRELLTQFETTLDEVDIAAAREILTKYYDSYLVNKALLTWRSGEK